MQRFAFCGHEFLVFDGSGLYWPARSALIVADLHLEKASWFAQRGQMLPPYDSRATLERLRAIIVQSNAREIWCLGDNFHDDAGPQRLPGDARAQLAEMTTALPWYWIVGNHDEHLPDSVGGTIIDEAIIDGLTLRHRATAGDPAPELSGHFHPKFRTGVRGRSVSRPCFVVSATKLILPAFGSLTGGLAADHPEIVAATGTGADALIATASQMLSFALPR